MKRTRPGVLAAVTMMTAFASQAFAVERIIFDARDIGTEDRDIWIADPNGSDAIQLTSDGGSYHPRISPDGTEIVFACGELACVMGVDGSNPQVVCPDAPLPDPGGMYGAVWPAWSPTGDRIAVMILQHPHSRLYICDISDRENTTVVHNTALSGRSDDIDWIPGTESLTLANETTANNSWTRELFTIQSDGTNLDQCTSDGTEDKSPNVSPDGTHVVWAHYMTEYSEHRCFTADFDGSCPIVDPVQCSPDNCLRPVWSPDGTEFMYACGSDLCKVTAADCSGHSTVLHRAGYGLYMGDWATFPDAIPTVSDWGLIAMALLVLTVGKLMFMRHKPAAS